MSESCVCHIVANFPYLVDYGIISATLKTNKNVVVTEGGLVLYGPTLGDLSITAYSPLPTGTVIGCPSRAGVGYEWDQRFDCESRDFRVYFIPRGKDRAYIEGDAPSSQITMTSVNSYTTFSASAASGPFSLYLELTHKDGYNFRYSGPPIQIDSSNGRSSTSVPFLASILPAASRLYLTNFAWEYNPPNIPTVSYSFLFSGE